MIGHVRLDKVHYDMVDRNQIICWSDQPWPWY